MRHSYTFSSVAHHELSIGDFICISPYLIVIWKPTLKTRWVG